METTLIWYLIVGTLLIVMGLMESVLQRLPLSPAMFYLPIGYMLGPSGFSLLTFDLLKDAGALTIATEIALLISLFTVGLKMRVSLRDPIWRLPLRLGSVAMVVTVGLLTVVGISFLNLPLGVAVLLAAVLAPTDPILASDVQLKDVGDRDRIRFSLSGEGGMNDGTTYPFVMLGLALLAVPEASNHIGVTGLFLALWGIVAGVGAGFGMGWAVARLVVYLRRRHQSALGMEEFLTIGLIALSFGAAQLIHGIGFVAVFATGVAVRRIESHDTGDAELQEVLGAVPLADGSAVASVATDPKKAPAYMTEMVLGFNEQLEHIAEFAMVLLVGVLVSTAGLSTEGVVVAALLFLVIRPVSVAVATIGLKRARMQTALMAWFGIRGIGSLYYLMYCLQYGWSPTFSPRFISIVLTVICLSIVIHGISSTPLMDLYYRSRRRNRGRSESESRSEKRGPPTAAQAQQEPQRPGKRGVNVD